MGSLLKLNSECLTSPSAYQEYLGKIMTDKYTHLSRGMDKVINDANTEIQNLQEKVMSKIWLLLRVFR